MAFNNVTEWRRVEQLSEIKTSRQGNPQRGVRTEKGWVTVRGAQALLSKMQVGLSVEIGSLSEFTNPSTQKTAWYGQLMNVGEPPKAPPPPPLAEHFPEQQAKESAPSPAANGAKPSNGKIPWLEFAAFFKATHEMLREVEPDSTSLETGIIDRSSARATMMNTCVMAFEHGRIDAPEVPDMDDDGTVPF
jgi:hypothetical protein